MSGATWPKAPFKTLTFNPEIQPCTKRLHLMESHRVHWTWLGLMSWSCWYPASSSLPPSAWWITEVWIVGLLPTIHTLCHPHWMCYNSVMIPSGHMTSILSILERDPPLLLSWRFLLFFSPVKDCFSISWEFFLIRCESSKGQGCRMCTDCKDHWGTFVICDVGLHEMNWIESSYFPCVVQIGGLMAEVSSVSLQIRCNVLPLTGSLMKVSLGELFTYSLAWKNDGKVGRWRVDIQWPEYSRL